MLKILDFYADWCGPCKQLKENIKKLTEDKQNLFEYINIELDNAEDLINTHGIRNLPTLIFIKDNHVVHRHTGLINDIDLNNKIDELGQ